MKYLNCVYEDELTSSVIKRLVNDFSSQISIAQEINAHGFGKIKRDILKYNNAAKQTPFFVITDLDKKECAVTLIREEFPPKDSYAHQGPLYNILLTEFVASEWNLKAAMLHSKSLEKAYNALKTFAEK